ncbi:Actin patch protein 1 [Blumeria hordei DH14]|uniref:Actin patch protein 1 n=1 Tax=Blumeria graminis f. sp. hordei (strain DH14) TaxID=546991 RepID=N1JCL9_BLUG1|nr:Actin patch protein 1 [Blumeria hordei DH14]
MSSISSLGEAFERGSRRKKLTDYLKAANDMRQSYQQTYLEKWTSNYFETNDDQSRNFGDSPSTSKAVTNGNQELIIFPSYAKRHTKSNRIRSVEYCHLNTIRNIQSHPKDVENDTIHELQDNQQQESFSYKEDQAVVDVDVRGWIYSPHKGPLTGKLKLLIGLARQLSGIPAPEVLNQEQSSNQSPLVTKPNFNKHLGNEPNQDAYLHGDAKNDANAASGKYCNSESSYPTNLSNDLFESKNMPKKISWNLPSDMSQAEINVANSNLMSRLYPFMANPLISKSVSIFFYNEKTSISKTVTTNETGHFTLRAALDFVPTHVRVLVSEELSVTEVVKITEPKGVSLISDVDDTIKHTSITAGAREAFRNAFVRNLEELTIDGVREWYNSMYDMGVGIHYVSNSPWQLFPTLLKFSRGAGLPPGSYHLKHYNGMLQGILEPVSERKKPIIAKILSDFPERSFILVGDSGEADLEVYCDIVLSNPGRVIMVLIRDMMHDFSKSTTSYFDSIQNYSDSSSYKMNIKEGQASHRVSNSTADQLVDQSKEMPKVFLPTAGVPTIGKLVDIDQKSSQNNHEPKKKSVARPFSSVESGKGHQKNFIPVTDEGRNVPPRPPKPMALRAPPFLIQIKY